MWAAKMVEQRVEHLVGQKAVYWAELRAARMAAYLVERWAAWKVTPWAVH